MPLKAIFDPRGDTMGVKSLPGLPVLRFVSVPSAARSSMRYELSPGTFWTKTTSPAVTVARAFGARTAGVTGGAASVSTASGMLTNAAKDPPEAAGFEAREITDSQRTGPP